MGQLLKQFGEPLQEGGAPAVGGERGMVRDWRDSERRYYDAGDSDSNSDICGEVGEWQR